MFGFPSPGSSPPGYNNLVTLPKPEQIATLDNSSQNSQGSPNFKNATETLTDLYSSASDFSKERAQIPNLLESDRNQIGFFSGDYRITILWLALNPGGLDKIRREMSKISSNLGTKNLYNSITGQNMGLRVTNPYLVTQVQDPAALKVNYNSLVVNGISTAIQALRANQPIDEFIETIVDELVTEERIPQELAESLKRKKEELKDALQRNSEYYAIFREGIEESNKETNQILSQLEQQQRENYQKVRPTAAAGENNNPVG